MKHSITVVAVALASLASLGTVAQAQDTTELRIGMVAPEGSQWTRVFRVWDQELRKQTGGAVGLALVPGNNERSEDDLLEDLRAGRLDGAWLSSNALGQIARPVLVMAIPGLITDYTQFNRVRRRVGGSFDRAFRREGYELLGWGEAGKSRIFSDRRIERPQDLRQAHPWAPADDRVLGAFYSAAGASPVRRSFTQVAGALESNQIGAVTGSSLVAGGLLWYTHLQFYTEQPISILFGGTVLKGERFDALPEDQQTIVRDTARQAHRLLSRALKREDERMTAVIGRRLTAVDTSAHAEEWSAAFERARGELVPGVISQSLLDRALSALQD